MEFRALDEFSKKYIPLLDSYMRDLLRGSPEELYSAAMHLIKAGGKRLRPLMVIATARALGGPDAEARALSLAIGIEIFHNFTLVHDDIMDNDDYRRGMPTVHKVYGIPLAITAGDLMFSMAFLSVIRAVEVGLGHELTVKAARTFADASRKVAEGQGYDILFEKLWDVDENDYLKMIYLKTAALMEASASLGAIAAKARDEVVEAMGEYGRLVGLAFQIRDDIIGLYGDPAKTGKPVYSDLRRGKKTLLVIYAAARDQDLRRKLESIFTGKLTEESLREAAEGIKATGALSYAEGLAQSYSQMAIERLERLRSSGLIVDEEAYSVLRELALFSAQRDK